MTTIHSTIDIPHGWHKWYLVRDLAQAETIAAGVTGCYLYQSQIIPALYLIMPVAEVTS